MTTRDDFGTSRSSVGLSRRNALRGTAGVLAATFTVRTLHAAPAHAPAFESAPTSGDFAASVHTYQAGPTGAYVNAYLVETTNGVVVIDGTLTVTDSRAVRAKLEALGKPLLAVLVTHPHPDHYAGVTEVVGGDDVPVVATADVDAIIRRDDAVRNETASGLLGPEWPAARTFPTTTIPPGGSMAFDGIAFTVQDTGPGESGADTYWTASALPGVVFAGDHIYPYLDSYNADGFSGRWLEKLDRLEAELGDAAVLYPGHGGAATLAALDWQRRYLQFLRATVRDLANGQPSLSDAQKAAAKQRMDEFVPDQRLEFFLDISLDSVAAELAGSE